MALLVGSMFAYLYSFFGNSKQHTEYNDDFILITNEDSKELEESNKEQNALNKESKEESNKESKEESNEEYNQELLNDNHKLMHDKKRKNDSKKQKRNKNKNKNKR
jgi:hypothetical protein